MTTVLAELIQKTTALNQEQLSTVISYFKPVTVKKNKHLLQRGAIADRLFFINKGCLRLFYRIITIVLFIEVGHFIFI